MENKKLSPLFATLAVAASLSSGASALAAVGRGMNVEPLAANCQTGKFPQTSKAGQYNVLCNVMQDSEKCLALIKGQFSFDGTNVTVAPVDHDDQAKAQYCLDVLRTELGL
jgi:hypothetical protein